MPINLSKTDMLSAAKEVFCKNAFSEVTVQELVGIDSSNQCIFEDSYCVVAIVAYETWNELVGNWANAQASFVELVSDYITRDEKKIWDCYLVLLTPDYFPRDQSAKRQSIRYDIGRVRKLIVSGEDASEISDVETALLPLLPIPHSIHTLAESSVLDRLPELLQSRDLSIEHIQAVVKAFGRQESMVEAIQKTGNTE